MDSTEAAARSGRTLHGQVPLAAGLPPTGGRQGEWVAPGVAASAVVGWACPLRAPHRFKRFADETGTQLAQVVTLL